MSDDRIQQLVKAGVAKSSADFSAEAQALIESLSDDEFNCLLSLRTKVLKQNGAGAQAELDKIICVVI